MSKPLEEFCFPGQDESIARVPQWLKEGTATLESQIPVAENGDHEKASKAHCQAGSTRYSVVSGDKFCGGEGTTRISGDEIPKGR